MFPVKKKIQSCVRNGLLVGGLYEQLEKVNVDYISDGRMETEDENQQSDHEIVIVMKSDLW